MNEASRDQAESQLADAVSLWRLAPTTSVPEVIDAAVNCLVAEMDSPSLRELAGVSPRESRFVLDPLIVDTVNELGLSQILDADVQVAALGAVLRKFKSDQFTSREVAAWAHTHIGHDGGPGCEPFVALDDMYDEADFFGFEEEQLDEWLRLEAEAFLARRPSPGFTTNWPLLPEQAVSAGLLKRFRGRLRSRRQRPRE